MKSLAQLEDALAVADDIFIPLVTAGQPTR
jgi:hypothetical protein